MKKVFITLLILVSSAIYCSQNSREPPDGPKAAQTADIEENLIISDEHINFSEHKVTFIELGADKCIPCKAMQPVMREIAQEYKGTIQVVFYDVWKTPKYAKDFSIQIIPTQVFIDKNGDEIFRHIGFFAKDEIIEMLKEKDIL